MPLSTARGSDWTLIDMLEIALAISQQYGVKLKADDKNNIEIFNSLRSLNTYIQRHRGA